MLNVHNIVESHCEKEECAVADFQSEQVEEAIEWRDCRRRNLLPLESQQRSLRFHHDSTTNMPLHSPPLSPFVKRRRRREGRKEGACNAPPSRIVIVWKKKIFRKPGDKGDVTARVQHDFSLRPHSFQL